MQWAAFAKGEASDAMKKGVAWMKNDLIQG